MNKNIIQMVLVSNLIFTMWDQAQGGSNPQSTNPGIATPAGQVPGGQAPNPGVQTDKSIEPDYKSYFEEQMGHRVNERNSIQEKLKDSKISDAEKNTLRTRELDIREELLKHQYGQAPQKAPDLTFVPEAKRQFLQDTLKKVSPDEAAAILDYTRQLYDGIDRGNLPAPVIPANLDTHWGNGNPPGQAEVRLNSKNLLWIDVDKETVDATRKGFWEFLGQLQS